MLSLLQSLSMLGLHVNPSGTIAVRLYIEPIFYASEHIDLLALLIFGFKYEYGHVLLPQVSIHASPTFSLTSPSSVSIQHSMSNNTRDKGKGKGKANLQDVDTDQSQSEGDGEKFQCTVNGCGKKLSIKASLRVMSSSQLLVKTTDSRQRHVKLRHRNTLSHDEILLDYEIKDLLEGARIRIHNDVIHFHCPCGRAYRDAKSGLKVNHLMGRSENDDRKHVQEHRNILADENWNIPFQPPCSTRVGKKNKAKSEKTKKGKRSGQKGTKQSEQDGQVETPEEEKHEGQTEEEDEEEAEESLFCARNPGDEDSFDDETEAMNQRSEVVGQVVQEEPARSHQIDTQARLVYRTRDSDDQRFDYENMVS